MASQQLDDERIFHIARGIPDLDLDQTARLDLRYSTLICIVCMTRANGWMRAFVM